MGSGVLQRIFDMFSKQPSFEEMLEKITDTIKNHPSLQDRDFNFEFIDWQEKIMAQTPDLNTQVDFFIDNLSKEFGNKIAIRVMVNGRWGDNYCYHGEKTISDCEDLANRVAIHAANTLDGQTNNNTQHIKPLSAHL